MVLAPFVALTRFHLRVGARLALRAAAPFAGLPLFAVLLSHDPSGSIRDLARWLLRPDGGPGPGALLAALVWTLTAWAMPRVTAGLSGWPRHLPISGSTHRRAALVAVFTTQVPLAAALVLLVAVALADGAMISEARILSVPIQAAAAALGLWPGEHPWRVRSWVCAAGALTLTAGPPELLAATLLLIVAETHAEPLLRPAPASRRSSTANRPLFLLVSLRALGVGAVSHALVALLPVGAMALFRSNNTLAPELAAGAARLGVGLGVAFLLAALAQRLALRRPVWPWARSLPRSARRRIVDDALVLAAACLVPVVATAFLDPVAASTMAASVPLLAFRAAGALRGSAAATAVFLFEAALFAGGLALLPWLAGLALVAAPWALRGAAERDRRLKVGAFDERRHLAAGDSLSGEAR